MFNYIGNPNSIKDLNLANFHLAKIERKDIPILVIDDEIFDYKDELERHDFNIMYMNDIDKIDLVLPYEIILCDIKGIGKKFKSPFEGAHIISEIRKKYPFKTILAFSAYLYNASFNKYLRMADNTLKKDIGIDDWVEKLDDAIDSAKNPALRWIKVRDHLIEKDIPLFDIVKLENEYVKQLNKNKNLNNFPSKTLTSQFSDDVKAVLTSFTASVIFKLIFPS
ncbi:MAG: hypothetical protein HQ541_15235 [Mariniphaga sp.]|nr:hypothetical protein [Mariniphaga sp.]